jgi:hypothetical protein
MNSLQKEREEQTMRKPYNTPQVQVYGDLRQITQNQAKGAADHLNGPGNPAGGTH